jgi:hypothetical protein
MDLKERIKSFASLGETLRESLNNISYGYNGNGHYHSLHKIIETQVSLNPWFTPDNVKRAITSIANELTIENLTKWTGAYKEISNEEPLARVAVIMAGNIPLVGFHDFLSVLITGNKLVAKTSSKDSQLLVHVAGILCKINPLFKDRIEFTNGTLTDFDAVIATGSDNSSRYFEYYFGKYPNIIRKNRNSIAIIEGNEADEELARLGEDIFSYFGLGCRNVSKIYIPKGFDQGTLLSKWDSFHDIIKHTKYSNNYDFNKAVYIVNKETFFDTGYLLLKEDKRISSPVSVLFYEYYEGQDALKQVLETLKEKIQCITGKLYIPFGQAQWPHLWDYADGIDTIDFLLKKKLAGIL